jgi:hypothetical protein
VKTQACAGVVIALLCFSSFILNGVSGHCATQKEKPSWLNPDSSPLVFTPNRETGLVTVVNRKKVVVTGYQLGCVGRDDSGIFAIVGFEPRIRVELGEDRYGLLSLRALWKEIAACESHNGQLTAVRAEFSDGSIWMIPPFGHTRTDAEPR